MCISYFTSWNLKKKIKKMLISYPRIRICVFLRATRHVYLTLRCLTLFRILGYKIGLFRIVAYKILRKGNFVTMGGLRVMKGGLNSNFQIPKIRILKNMFIFFKQNYSGGHLSRLFIIVWSFIFFVTFKSFIILNL
jgi:hypothetical protein